MRGGVVRGHSVDGRGSKDVDVQFVSRLAVDLEKTLLEEGCLSRPSKVSSFRMWVIFYTVSGSLAYTTERPGRLGSLLFPVGRKSKQKILDGVGSPVSVRASDFDEEKVFSQRALKDHI